MDPSRPNCRNRPRTGGVAVVGPGLSYRHGRSADSRKVDLISSRTRYIVKDSISMRVNAPARLAVAWLTMFLVGTELFVFSPLLPVLAADYHIAPPVAGGGGGRLFFYL